jgi:hypothetical protein
LGVYLADLNYCIIYKEPEYIKKYFNVTRELSLSMGVEKNVLDYLASRYEKNIQHNDSVKKYFTQLYSKSTTTLKATDREVQAGITIAGYQIESLYQLLTIIQGMEGKEISTQAPLLNVLLQQQNGVTSVLNFLKYAGDEKNPNTFFIISSYRDLQRSFEEMNASQIKDATGSDILNEKRIVDLLSKVSLIREQITAYD